MRKIEIESGVKYTTVRKHKIPPTNEWVIADKLKRNFAIDGGSPSPVPSPTDAGRSLRKQTSNTIKKGNRNLFKKVSAKGFIAFKRTLKNQKERYY